LTLADGRIVSVGGTDPECPGTCDPPPPSWDSIEIYSPPFLFAQDRPQILNSVQPSGLIADLDPSEPLTLEVVLPGTIEANSEFRVALLRPSAVTHANDMSQRYIRLRVIAVVKNDPPASSLIDILGPSSRMVAPAGHYMITVVSSDGVPSVAKWVRISPP
jgi:hypothetical protein